MNRRKGYEVVGLWPLGGEEEARQWEEAKSKLDRPRLKHAPFKLGHAWPSPSLCFLFLLVVHLYTSLSIHIYYVNEHDLMTCCLKYYFYYMFRIYWIYIYNLIVLTEKYLLSGWFSDKIIIRMIFIIIYAFSEESEKGSFFM